MPFPPPPANLEWATLSGLQETPDNGHIEVKFSVKTGEWTTPALVRSPMLQIHGLSPALNYGQQAYEGLRCHRDPNGNILLFRLADHARRMATSCGFVAIPAVPEYLFIQCVRLAVAANAEYVAPHGVAAALYIRPVIFGSSAQVPMLPADEYTFCVYTQPFPAYHGVNAIPACIVDGFDRAAPQGTGRAKIGGNYAPTIPWMLKARQEGFAITLHLDSKTQSVVEEFSTSAFIGVKCDGRNVTLVMPDSNNIVPSVTSDSCAVLATSLGWVVEKRPVPYSELGLFQEVIAAGTAACLVGIASISYKQQVFNYAGKGPNGVNGHAEAKMTNGNGHGVAQDTGFSPRETLNKMLKNIQDGNADDPFGWIEQARPVDEILPGMIRR